MLKNRMIFILLFILSLVLLFSYGGIVSYTFFVFSLLVPVISIVYTIVVYYRFKVIQTLDKKHVIKGDIINYKCEICNEDMVLYPYIKAKFFSMSNIFSKKIEDKYFSLMPNTSLNYTTELNCKYKGIYEIGIKYIEIEDFLGIFKIRYIPLNYIVVKVEPRIIKLRRVNFNLCFSSDSDILGSSSSVSNVFSDIRKYVYGDSFRKIHWKYTSKYGELMSKNYQSSSEADITVIVDIKRFSDDKFKNIVVEDTLIESVIALANYCLSNFIKINLLMYNGELLEVKSKNSQDFNNLYNIISSMKFIDDFDINTVIDLYLRMNNNKSSIFLFSFNVNYSLFDSMYEFILAGFSLNLVYVNYLEDDVDGEKDKIFENLSQMGMRKFEIKSCEEISNVFELTN